MDAPLKPTDEEAAVAMEARDAGAMMQEDLDSALPAVVGMYTEPTLGSLVDAVNQALAAAGIEGSYPPIEGSLTELPVDLVRLLVMLNDAAAESGVPVNLDLAMLEDDRDLAILASEIAKLAAAPEFAATMTADVGVPPGDPVAPPVGAPQGAAPPPPVQSSAGDEEALMMQRI